jgi:peptide/nickel transport system substrate-binding protein
MPGSRNYAGVADPQVDADITALNAAKTNADLETAAHALDRQIMSGCYFIPLYYAPADWVAYWPDKIRPPQKLSLYGTALEAWHAAP